MVRWDGWWDDLAGIYEYELEVFLMTPLGNKLQRFQKSVNNGTYNSSNLEQLVNLTDPGKLLIIFIYRISQMQYAYIHIHVYACQQIARKTLNYTRNIYVYLLLWPTKIL